MSISQLPRRKQLLYVPGLISLILLLPLCWEKINDANIFEIQHCIEVTWYDEKMQKQFPIPARNYHDILLTGDQRNDAIKLDYSRIMVREMFKAGDTINAVRIHFSDTSKYDSFVHVLNMCEAEAIRRYAVTMGSIIIWNDIPIHQRYPAIVGFCGGVIFDRPKIPVPDKASFLFDYDFNKNDWTYAVAFLALVAFSIFNRKTTRTS